MCYYLLASLGVTYILKYSTLLENTRKTLGRLMPVLVELFHCAMCLGFWSGVLIAPMVAATDDILYAVLFPFASAAWCWIIDELHDAVVVWKHRD
jgi:hypothetical protein